jgi:hypothetical protein
VFDSTKSKMDESNNHKLMADLSKLKANDSAN